MLILNLSRLHLPLDGKLEQAALSDQSRHHVLTDREETNLQTLAEEG